MIVKKKIAVSESSGSLRARWFNGHICDALRNFREASATCPDNKMLSEMILFLSGDAVQFAATNGGLLPEAVKAQLHIYYDAMLEKTPTDTCLRQGLAALDKLFDKPLFIQEDESSSVVIGASPPLVSQKAFFASETFYKILMVDDSSTIVKIFKRNFSSFVTIDSTKTVAEARRLCSLNTYDGVVLDNHIGEDSGVDFATELRTMGECPILMLSGSLPSAADANVLAFLSVPIAGKPLRKSDLDLLLLATIKENDDQKKRVMATINGRFSPELSLPEESFLETIIFDEQCF